MSICKSLSPQNFLAQGHKTLLIDLIGQARETDLLELKLVIGQSFECFFTSFLINKSFPLQVEKHKNIADLFLTKNTNFESYAIM